MSNINEVFMRKEEKTKKIMKMTEHEICLIQL